MPVSAYFIAKTGRWPMIFLVLHRHRALRARGLTFGHVQMTLGTAGHAFAVLVLGSVTFSGPRPGHPVTSPGPNSAATDRESHLSPHGLPLRPLGADLGFCRAQLQKVCLSSFRRFHYSQDRVGRIIGAGRFGVSPLRVHIIAMFVATALFLAIAYFAWPDATKGKMYELGTPGMEV